MKREPIIETSPEKIDDLIDSVPLRPSSDEVDSQYLIYPPNEIDRSLLTRVYKRLREEGLSLTDEVCEHIATRALEDKAYKARLVDMIGRMDHRFAMSIVAPSDVDPRVVEYAKLRVKCLKLIPPIEERLGEPFHVFIANSMWKHFLPPLKGRMQKPRKPIRDKLVLANRAMRDETLSAISTAYAEVINSGICHFNEEGMQDALKVFKVLTEDCVHLTSPDIRICGTRMLQIVENGLDVFLEREGVEVDLTTLGARFQAFIQPILLETYSPLMKERNGELRDWLKTYCEVKGLAVPANITQTRRKLRRSAGLRNSPEELSRLLEEISISQKFGLSAG